VNFAFGPNFGPLPQNSFCRRLAAPPPLIISLASHPFFHTTAVVVMWQGCNSAFQMQTEGKYKYSHI
jgi:hypothetical protein